MTLSRDGNVIAFRVHRLVLEAFVGLRPDGLECCHEDGDKTNNRLGNLRWDTKLANAADKKRHGTGAGSRLRGEENGNAKLTVHDVREIRRRYAMGGTTQASLGSEFDVTKMNVSRIVRCVTWLDA